MYPLEAATLIGYAVLAVAWAVLEKKKHGGRLVAAALSIALAGPFFMALGSFLGKFSNNICYAEVVGAVADLPGTYLRAGNTQALSEFGALRQKLPLYGYETNCEELRTAVQSLK
jgi:hypothetical protein